MKYPELVKTNARYRGPRESGKQLNANRDITSSIKRLRGEFEDRKKAMDSLRTDMFTLYNTTIPSQRTTLINGVISVKGGELQ